MGFPRGRIVEVYGPESSGKTTLTLTVVAQAQKAGGLAAFIDVEHALDPGYARKLGVNLDDLLVSQPSSGEEALRICETLVRSNALDVIVLDSVAALVTRQELDGEIGDSTVGAQARLMSAALRKLTAIIAKARTCCIFTNQIREKIGVMFGNPETTPGGKALKFYASVRIDIRRIGAIKTTDGTVTGNRTTREGGEEQGRAALHRGGVRHHVQRGHQRRRLAARSRDGLGHPAEARLVDQLQGHPGRPGPRCRQGGPQERSEALRGDRSRSESQARGKRRAHPRQRALPRTESGG